MSSITILGDTSGSVLLQAPAVAGSSTVTLPTTGGTIRTTTTPGTVLQILQTAVTTAQSTTSSPPTKADVGLNVTITPTSATSKILVTANGFISGSQTANIYCFFVRNNTALTNAYYGVVRIGQDAQAEYQCQPFAYQYLDSPATTSATTYSFKFSTNYATAYLNRPANTGGFSDVLTSTITVMEIAA